MQLDADCQSHLVSLLVPLCAQAFVLSIYLSSLQEFELVLSCLQSVALACWQLLGVCVQGVPLAQGDSRREGERERERERFDIHVPSPDWAEWIEYALAKFNSLYPKKRIFTLEA